MSRTQHSIGDDIRRGEHPTLNEVVPGKVIRVHALPRPRLRSNLRDIQLMNHSGYCVHNRRKILSRILTYRRADVPITNCSVTIALPLPGKVIVANTNHEITIVYTPGISQGDLQPFASALLAYEQTRNSLPPAPPALIRNE